MKVHCWHPKTDVQVATLEYPPKIKEVCCWCGTTRVRHAQPRKPEGHGEYAPEEHAEYLYIYPQGVTENCPSRPE